jgi:hypothetical protein
MRVVLGFIIALTLFSMKVNAADQGCATAERSYADSLKEFRLVKGYYCQAYLNCGTAYGFPSTLMNVDMTLSIPGGDDSGYDSCMAPYTKDLNESAKKLTAWELARCEEHSPEADVYLLCGGGTANRHLAPQKTIISQNW